LQRRLVLENEVRFGSVHPTVGMQPTDMKTVIELNA
jgi:hypothetical protein